LAEGHDIYSKEALKNETVIHSLQRFI